MSVLTAVSPASAPLRSSFVADLRERQPTLTAAGLFCLLVALVLFALPLVDIRTIDGVNVWIKPAKFFLSTGVLMLTMAWAYGLARPERRNVRPLVWSLRILLAFAAFELAYITVQAARGEASHFNVGDPLHMALFAAMGAAATGMLAAKIPLAVEIARRPNPASDHVLVFAAVLGIALTVVLGTLSGFAMGARLSHAVGPEAGHLPLFGWNRLGGDLRVAHFVGMHAEQALPLLAGLLAAVGVARRRRWMALAGLALTAATIAVGFQALAGRPFPFG